MEISEKNNNLKTYVDKFLYYEENHAIGNNNLWND